MTIVKGPDDQESKYLKNLNKMEANFILNKTNAKLKKKKKKKKDAGVIIESTVDDIIDKGKEFKVETIF